MTRDETKQLLMMVKALYPNFDLKPDQMTVTINAWQMMLDEYPADSISAALKIYVKTNNTGFAPSVSQIISCMHAPKSNDRLTEGEAWALVKKAISNGNYGSEEEFNKLPPEVQRAVGGAEMIRQWALCDTSEVNTVVMSNFQRTYKAILSKQEFEDRVPTAISDVVKQISEKVAPGIGVNE